MTLGGLALAVGILVDDATVTIENIDRHLTEGKSVIDSIRDGAAQIAVPAFVSTLCICIVFVPIFFLSGVAKYLFVPLAQAVIFAMLASYVLSRTLVPTLAMSWMKGHSETPGRGRPQFFLLAGAAAIQTRLRAPLRTFPRKLSRLVKYLSKQQQKGGSSGHWIRARLRLSLFPFLGEDFFPSVTPAVLTCTSG